MNQRAFPVATKRPPAHPRQPRDDYDQPVRLDLRASPVNNAQISSLFDETADLLEVQGANPFRVRAYRNGARAVKNHPDQFSAMLEAGDKPTGIKGIGKDLAAKIEEAVANGQIAMLEELREEVPPVTLDMLKIPGLGPKKVATILQELEVSTIHDLKAAAESGQVAELSGFGKKTAVTIIDGIEHLETVGSRTYLATAKEAADQIANALGELDSTVQVEVAGSCRRRRETCGDLDVLVASTDPGEAMDALANHPLVETTLARGETKQRVRLVGRLELDLRAVPEKSFGAALQYFTGSKEHNIVMRQRAIDRGLKLNEYGLFKDDEQVAGASEEEIYSTLDLPWIPPELREDRREFDWATNNDLPELITIDQIRGDMHMHTTATDGKNTIREMAEAARDRGLSYIAITDHSKRVSMAGGLDADALLNHWDAIRDEAKSIDGIEVLCGIECDILEDATLDLPDDVLAEADWVLAVLHYGLRQPKEQIEKRLLASIENPHVDCIGHPTGRIVGKRQGAEADWTKMLDAAAEHGVLMEINANPARLDLDDVLARAATDRGINIVISTDAHSTAGLDVMEWGIYQARRAGLAADDIANTRTWPEFRKLMR